MSIDHNKKHFFWIRRYVTHMGRNKMPLVTMHRIGAVSAYAYGEAIAFTATLCSPKDKFDDVEALEPLFDTTTLGVRHRTVMQKEEALNLSFSDLMKLLKFRHPAAIQQLGFVPTRHHNRALRRIVHDVFGIKMNKRIDKINAQKVIQTLASI